MERIRRDLDTANRENEALKSTNSSLESELSRLKDKLLQFEGSSKDLTQTIEALKNEAYF